MSLVDKHKRVVKLFLENPTDPALLEIMYHAGTGNVIYQKAIVDIKHMLTNDVCIKLNDGVRRLWLVYLMNKYNINGSYELEKKIRPIFDNSNTAKIETLINDSQKKNVPIIFIPISSKIHATLLVIKLPQNKINGKIFYYDSLAGKFTTKIDGKFTNNESIILRKLLGKYYNDFEPILYGNGDGSLLFSNEVGQTDDFCNSYVMYIMTKLAENPEHKFRINHPKNFQEKTIKGIFYKELLLPFLEKVNATYE